MRLSEQERSAAQADLDRLTGELVRLYQLREQLKLALNEEGGEAIAEGLSQLTAEVAEVPSLRIVQGSLACDPERNPDQRRALREKFQLIQGGLS
jgi:hypothetical protein